MIEQVNSHTAEKNQPVIHRAPWVVADVAHEIYGDCRGIIEDGAVAVSDNIIKGVGRSKEIFQEFGGHSVQEHEYGALVPALINSHCHLELSHLDLADSGKKNKDAYESDPTLWIRDLIKARDSFLQGSSEAEGQVTARAVQSLEKMSAEGVGFVGDIGNSLESRTIGQGHRTEVKFLLELLGLSKESEEQSLARLEMVLADAAVDIACTAHAPYSTTPTTIKRIKESARLHNSLFSIHTAESVQEVEFLKNGKGVFLDFLVEREAWDGSFKSPGMGPVSYLDSLGVLDDRTLCVHAVHLDRDEIATLAARKTKVCLCPGSNRFLGVGKAPVTEFIAHGILPALGTDSLASNEILSIWREMCLLREDHPELSPATVFSMATRGGAEAWGIDSDMGTIAPGRQAGILSVEYPDTVRSGEDLLESLTTAGISAQAEWII